MAFRKLNIGHFSVAFEDLSVAMPGLSIAATRSYDSRRVDAADFGIGWDLAVSSMRLAKNEDLGRGWRGEQKPSVNLGGVYLPVWCNSSPTRKLVVITLPDGTGMAFKTQLETHPSVRQFAGLGSLPDPSCSLVLQQQVKMTFVPFGKTRGTLEPVDPVVSVDYPQYNDGPYGLGAGKAGVVYTRGGLLSKGLPGWDPVYEPTKFKYTSPEGTVFMVEAGKGVLSVQDRNANSLTFTDAAITHSNGMAITFTRDAQHRITHITDPAGAQLLYSYDTAGRLTSFTDRTGALTQYRYTNDAFPNYLTEIIDPLGNRAVKSLYDASGRLVGQEDADGNVVTMAHDLTAYKETTTDRLGQTTVHEYDLNGNIVKTTNALGGITLRTYDARDRELSVTDPLGHTTSKTYDGSDNVLTETNALGHTTHYTYNTNKQPLSITDSLGHTTAFSYDGNGNLLTMTDAAGNATGFAYNADGTLLSTTDAHGTSTSYTYDGNGNQLTSTNFSSQGAILQSQSQQTFSFPRIVGGGRGTVARGKCIRVFFR